MNFSAMRKDAMEGDTTMMIIALASAMTVAMLIATAIGLHQESQREKLEEKRVRARGFRY
jgi:hypothetical protein